MGYERKKTLFDLSIVDVDNGQIVQNEISLGRWIVDAITLLLSLGESYNLAEEIPIKQLGITYIPTLYLFSIIILIIVYLTLYLEKKLNT